MTERQAEREGFRLDSVMIVLSWCLSGPAEEPGCGQMGNLGENMFITTVEGFFEWVDGEPLGPENDLTIPHPR